MSLPLLAFTCLTLVTLCYCGKCWLSPFGRCRKCRGFGYAVRTTRRGRPKRGRDCRRCRATGRRIRTGRWLYNRWARIHRAGTDQSRTEVTR
ncbi:hypothetical protein GCM10010400_61700 [Streptomyces aculeolatus]|uniref:hypothetical protein n=1 Tax=Streptomyces aculeolatus TaxID=270689 RepID=UPI001CEDE67B|nr:hypothetical protein [Streptomyces aculeolatus]